MDIARLVVNWLVGIVVTFTVIDASIIFVQCQRRLKRRRDVMSLSEVSHTRWVIALSGFVAGVNWSAILVLAVDLPSSPLYLGEVLGKMVAIGLLATIVIGGIWLLRSMQHRYREYAQDDQQEARVVAEARQIVRENNPS